jgi:hypothetical protein
MKTYSMVVERLKGEGKGLREKAEKEWRTEEDNLDGLSAISGFWAPVPFILNLLNLIDVIARRFDHPRYEPLDFEPKSSIKNASSPAGPAKL